MAAQPQLLLTLDPATGAVKIEGAVDSPSTALTMLASAVAAIARDVKAQGQGENGETKEPSRILKPPPGLHLALALK